MSWRARGEHSSPGFGTYWRGRGGCGRGTTRPKDLVSSGSSLLPRGQLIESSTLESLSSATSSRIPQPAIRSCEYLASFSWLQTKTPTVVIPGIPPRWTPLDEPRKLEEDSGPYFRDINTAHYPQYPLEPAVRAVLAQAPDLSLHEVDVFACGSTMGNLLRFAQKSDKPFQFVVETVGDTVFLIRRENSPDEKIPDVVGYGHSFPSTYTELEDCVKKADSHQRLIKYDFAGYQCVVRYEADGYLPAHVDDHVHTGHVQTLPKLEGLQLIPAGSEIPQKALFEIKTRSIRKKLTLESVLDGEIGRLWLRQVPNFILAYHTSGVFNDIQIHDVRPQMTAWEGSHQDDVKMVSAALTRIVNFARHVPSRRFEVCYSLPGVLEFRHVGGEFSNALPDDLRAVWSQTSSLSADSDEESDTAHGSDTEAGATLEEDEEDEDEEDFTACSQGCGYCGRCKYR